MKTILYFTAPWCKACKNLKPHLQRIEEKVKILEVNVDEDAAAAAEYDVMQLPTLVFLQDDAVIERKSGFSDAVVQALDAFVRGESA